MGDERQPVEIRYKVPRKFEAFRAGICLLDRQAGNVAPRSRQTCHKRVADRVPGTREDNRYGRCRLLCHQDCRRTIRDNDVHVKSNELSDDLGGALGASLRPSILDLDVMTFSPTEFSESVQEGCYPIAHLLWCCRTKESDCWQFR